MKKILAMLLACVMYTSANACNICGCGVGNYNPFLAPHFSNNFLSLGYDHRKYHLFHNGGQTDVTYNSLLLNGQYRVGKKLSVSASIPLLKSNNQFEKLSYQLSGVGDISLFANYNLLRKQTGNLQHSMIIGGGIKLPTGKYNQVKKNGDDEIIMQLGTGSMDYLLNGSYCLGYKKWAFIADGSYKYTTQNSENYRYGDVLTSQLTTVYNVELGAYSLSPFVQLTAEKHMQDADGHVLQDHTGGNVFFASGGLDLNTRKMGIGFSYSVPVSQNLDGGDVEVLPNYSVHLSFNF